MKRVLTLILMLWAHSSLFAQTTVRGIVKDADQLPVFGANVYFASNPQNGKITDFDGKFSLALKELTDTLIVSFVGFETLKINLKKQDLSKPLQLSLTTSGQTLDAMIIQSEHPISRQFSVVKMKKLDVYFNPVAQGDPLKAITHLPASTTTDESANPSLRGSSAERSRVILNGVPIYNPVRGSTLNNQGFFSLFNPEIMKQQQVFASNPPLTYGNSSAGLVEIQTTTQLSGNQLQLSSSLASSGFFLSQSLKKDVSFVQAFSNFQYDDALVGLHHQSMQAIKDFQTVDAGINVHIKPNKRLKFNSFNYVIDERFDGNSQKYAYQGELSMKKRRFFSVNNLSFFTTKGVISFNQRLDFSKQKIAFGKLNTNTATQRYYASLNFNGQFAKNNEFQVGLNYDYRELLFSGQAPLYYFALQPEAPGIELGNQTAHHRLEAYLYSTWEINDRWNVSLGSRTNIPLQQQTHYLSAQSSVKYQPHDRHSFLLSGGQYYSYSTPKYAGQDFSLLKSRQLALDYKFTLKNTKIQAAAYYKSDDGGTDLLNFTGEHQTKTMGTEFHLEQRFSKYFTFTVSNSFINQRIITNEKIFRGSKDFLYLLKGSLQYINPKLFTLSLAYSSRPGTVYTPVIDSHYHEPAGTREPVFDQNFNHARLGSYNRLDLGISRLFRLNKQGIIGFASLNNVLSQENEKEVLYSTDYKTTSFNYFQMRTFYMGVIWQVNY